jgi:hypothetical protein
MRFAGLDRLFAEVGRLAGNITEQAPMDYSSPMT